VEDKKEIVSEVKIWDKVTVLYEGESEPIVRTLVEYGSPMKIGYVSVESDFGKLIYGAKVGDKLSFKNRDGQQENFIVLAVKKPNSEELKSIKEQIEDTKSSIKRYRNYNNYDN
jgi:transcription elongation GreA/GreB family factor